MNYRVISATSSAAALLIFRADPEKFDLIITDYHMPEFDGLKLIQHCSGLNQVPVIMMTGALIVNKPPSVFAILQKPFMLEELSVYVEAALNPKVNAA